MTTSPMSNVLVNATDQAAPWRMSAGIPGWQSDCYWHWRWAFLPVWCGAAGERNQVNRWPRKVDRTVTAQTPQVSRRKHDVNPIVSRSDRHTELTAVSREINIPRCGWRRAWVWRSGFVEVPGIEPGSSVASSGLLRAQFTVPLLGPAGHVNKPV
jgi:hypothetical protein